MNLSILVRLAIVGLLCFAFTSPLIAAPSLPKNNFNEKFKTAQFNLPSFDCLSSLARCGINSSPKEFLKDFCNALYSNYDCAAEVLLNSCSGFSTAGGIINWFTKLTKPIFC